MALDLEADNVGVVIFGSDAEISEGSRLKAHGTFQSARACSVALSTRLATQSMVRARWGSARRRRVEVKAPGIIQHKCSCTSRANGPQGARRAGSDRPWPARLVEIGDRRFQPAVALDTFRQPEERADESDDESQKLYCIYVAIGQKRSTVAQIVRALEENGAMEYSIVSRCDGLEATEYLTYTGVATGEYFRDNGMHAVIVYDDLSKQAVAYRQMSLLLRPAPGGRRFLSPQPP